MVGIHQLPALSNLGSDFGNITFLDELGMDMVILNTANKLNPNVDILGLSCRLSKHTHKDWEVLGAINLEPSIQIEIFLDCFHKSIIVITITVLLGLGSLGLGGGLGGLLVASVTFFILVGILASSSSSLATASSSSSLPLSSNDSSDLSLVALCLPVMPWSFR